MALRIRIVTLAKTKQSFVLDGEAEYIKRLQKAWKVEIDELDSSRWNKLPSVQLQEKESALFQDSLPERAFVVMLDERGKSFDSKGFASLLSSSMSQGHSQIVFAIGGAYGWAESAKRRAQVLLSLSSLTFTYQMTRLILIEQLYRAHCTLSGISYQK